MVAIPLKRKGTSLALPVSDEICGESGVANAVLKAV